MQMVYIDFETFYDKEYTLKKTTPYEYILDPQWETIGCGVAVGDKDPFFLVGDEIGEFLKDYPKPYAVVSYNALFDASILAFRYGIHPDLLIDAMGVVRATLLHKIWNGRVNLENVSQVLHLPPKGDTVHKVSGMRRADIEAIPELWEEFKAYCLTDVKNCRSILKLLSSKFPKSELWIMDSVLKMCTRPNFFGDLNHLHEHLDIIITAKNELLDRVGLERADLLSSEKFACALRTLGVTPPTKLSPADPTKRIYAFAKTDEEFRELEEHENPDVQALVAARMGIRSTLEERRTQRFINMTYKAWGAFNVPWMPIALRYAGAHTHRLSGEWKVNMQNLPARKSKKLREALIAPPGYKVLAVDASQIEARLVAWLAGEEVLLQEFAKGHDVYVWFGSDMFKRVITKQNKLERFIAKNTVLGLGFQMGPKRFLAQLKSQAADNGIELPPDITLSQCEIWVQYYRTKFKTINKYWYVMESILKQMMQSNAPQSRVGPSYTDGTDLVLPNGLRLYYDNLRDRGGRKVFNYGGVTKEIYGGKFLENHVQALDRCHVMDAAKRIDDRLKAININHVRLAHQVHDELIYVVPDGLVNTLGVIAYEEMKTPCWWGVGLPLDAEVKVGQNYGNLNELQLQVA
jgi:hypothetical protein